MLLHSSTRNVHVKLVVVNQLCTYTRTYTSCSVVLGNAMQGAVDEQWMRSSCSVHTMYINCIPVTMYINTIYNCASIEI